MRRLKRRISRRQFVMWQQFSMIAPFDARHRDLMMAQQIVLLARAIGDNNVQVDDIVANPFEPTARDDMATILQAFQASG